MKWPNESISRKVEGGCGKVENYIAVLSDFGEGG